MTSVKIVKKVTLLKKNHNYKLFISIKAIKLYYRLLIR